MKRKPRREKTERKKLEDKLDHEFRWAVRERDGWICQGRTIKCKGPGLAYIPPTSALQCSHYHGRSERHVRWDLDNGDSQCGGCHMWFSAHPHDHSVWKQSRMTEDAYDSLVLRAHSSKHWSLEELEDMIEALQQYRQGLQEAA